MGFLFGEVLGRHGEHCQTQGGQVREALRHFHIQFFKCVKNAGFFQARYILSGSIRTIHYRPVCIISCFIKIMVWMLDEKQVE
jgi:hypothetical protein